MPWRMPNMNLTRQQLRYLRDIVLIMGLWPTVVYGANTTLATEFESIASLAYGVTFISSMLGGLAGTLHRMAKHLEPEASAIRHPKIFVAANMLGGLTAGWFSFFVGTQAGTPTLLVQGIVLLAAFGGSAAVERYVDKYLPPAKKD